MENINENPIAEEVTYDSPVVETPGTEEPVVEAVVEAPVAEEPIVEVPVLDHIEEAAIVEDAFVSPEPENQPDAISAPAYSAPEEVQALGAVAEGVIGATTAVKASPRKKETKPQVKKDTVAIHSTKNVTWPGVGKVYRGYNIVEKELADQWLTRSHIRIATPDEVAKEFGK